METERLKILNALNGWRITYHRDTLREKDVWSAAKAGVNMNTNTYDGIISMIKTKTWIQREALNEVK